MKTTWRFNSSALVYLLWSAALAWLYFSQRYLLFLAPKLGGLMLGASLALLIFAVASLAGGRESSSPPRGRLPSCLILLCPLVFLVMVPVGPAGSYAFEARSGEQTMARAYSGGNAARGRGVGDLHQTVVDINMNFPDNVGQQVVTEGMVTRMDDQPSGSIVVFRFAIVCCAADAQPVGVLVKGDGLEDLAKDAWIRVTGQLTKTKLNDDDIPTIQAEKIEHIQPPAGPYLN